MAVTKMIPVAAGTDINQIVGGAAQNLQSQGYEILTSIMGPESATMTVKRDRDGFKNVVGLGLECRVTLMLINGTQLNVNIDHEWTNKIIAIAIGWFFCLVPFITGIVGAVNQNDLPEKISTALMAAANGGATGYDPGAQYAAPQYNPMPQQPQYDPGAQYAAPQQPYSAPGAQQYPPYDPNQQPPQQ
ncbi:MAG: hypothetical protein IJL26_00065 [Clostridia bacterium]|nr:hypothetical protein [Clostridia bacterium]